MIINHASLDAALSRSASACELMDRGYAILRGAAPADLIAGIAADLSPRFDATPFCEGGFYGARTKRFGRLLIRSPRMTDLVMNPAILALAELALGNWCDRIQLNLAQAIELHPGALAQFPHRDQDMWQGALGEVEYLVNVMWPLTRFTADNGATVIWPHSHGVEALVEEPKVAPIVGEAEPGDAIVFLGSTLHGAGENRSPGVRRGIIVSYCLGWLKPYENQWLAYQITDLLTLHGGMRYTKDNRSYIGCSQDPDTDGTLRNAFNLVLGIAGTPLEIQPGGCINSLNGIPGEARFKLNEDNVSWRAGLDYQATPTTLLYANISRGYKSGSFPSVNSASTLQNRGVTQESVLAYEAGFKASLFDRKVQLNGAGFYYDYQDKQLRGRILDPFGMFGVLDVLLNVPKSRVYGAELSLDAAPVDGLRLNLAATYVNSRVTKDFTAYDPVANLFNYKGLPFPHTPKWNVTAGANYETALSSSLNGFVGANMTHQSATTGLFNDPALVGQTQASSTLRPGELLDPDVFKVKAYTTVDAQLGVAAEDGSWRAWIWGKNIFNTYYWNNTTQSLDALYRLAAMPATYGVTVSFRFGR